MPSMPSYVTAAQIGDSTDEQFVASIGIENFDVCVVAIGDDFQSSLETTALFKDLGAKFVLARATRDIHAKFLLRNGADQIIYIEKEMAERTAVKYGSENVFDYVELTPEYSIYEIPVPPSWAGKTIFQKEIRSKYHISILATKLDGNVNPLPKPDHVMDSAETLIIMGKNTDVKKLVK